MIAENAENHDPRDVLDGAAAVLKRKTAHAVEIVAAADRCRAMAAAISLAMADARTVHLNPVTPKDEARAAKAAHDRLSDDLDRLTAAIEALDAWREDPARAQREAAALSAYDRAEAECARVAARIDTEFPDVAFALADLQADIARAMLLAADANRNLPPGRKPIARPEGRARGHHDTDDLADGGAPYNSEIVRLVQVVVPDPGDARALLWPPAEPVHRLRAGGRGVPSLADVMAAFRASREAKSDG